MPIPAGYSVGAEFAEVRVDPGTGRGRVTRVAGAYDAGRVLNRRTLRSQALGGAVCAVGFALTEHTLVDSHRARVTGSISGGCVEGAVYDLAQQAVADGTAVLGSYGVADSDAGPSVGRAAEPSRFSSSASTGGPFPSWVLLRHLRSATPVALATFVEADPSWPEAGPGNHLACWGDGAAGGTGSPVLDAQTAVLARRLLAQNRSGTVRPGPAGADSAHGPRIFVDCLAPPWDSTSAAPTPRRRLSPSRPKYSCCATGAKGPACPRPPVPPSRGGTGTVLPVRGESWIAPGPGRWLQGRRGATWLAGFR